MNTLLPSQVGEELNWRPDRQNKREKEARRLEAEM